MARPTQDLMIATPLAMTVVGTTIKERGGEEEGSKGGREREKGVERQGGGGGGGTMVGMRDR